MSWSRLELWLSWVDVARPAATSSETTISIEVAVGMAIPFSLASSLRISTLLTRDTLLARRLRVALDRRDHDRLPGGFGAIHRDRHGDSLRPLLGRLAAGLLAQVVRPR